MENKNSTQNNPIDLKALKAQIFLKYRVELDDTSLIILSILTDQQNETFNNQNKIINTATEKINDSQRSLEVDKNHPLRQAFWFGFGKFGFALIFTIIVITIIYSFHHSYEKENSPAMTEWYRQYYENTKQLFTKKQMKEYLKIFPKPDEKE